MLILMLMLIIYITYACAYAYEHLLHTMSNLHICAKILHI